MTDRTPPDPGRPADHLATMLMTPFMIGALMLTLPQKRGGVADDTPRWLGMMAVMTGLGFTSWLAGKASVERVPAPSPSPPDLTPILDRLDRIAAALERSPVSTELPKAGPDLSDLSLAIAESRWADAEALLIEHAGHPEATGWSARLAEGKGAATERLNGELKAAQEVNDPARVVELRDALVPLLTIKAIRDLDAGVVKWLMAAIMRRLRTGTVRADVAELAATVADRFGQTVEGASLRASLPTLRRSAGLCPRCARPYRGIAEACPICLKAAPPIASDLADAEEEEINGINLADELPGEL